MALLNTEKKLVFCDYDDQSIKLIDYNGNYLGAYNPNSVFDAPFAVCVNDNDDIYVGDHTKKQIFVLNSSISLKFEISHQLIYMPYSMCIDNSSKRLYVAEWRKDMITIWNSSTGSYVDKLSVFSPLNIKLNSSDKLFIVSIECILVYDYRHLEYLFKIDLENWTNLRGITFDYDEINILIIARENKNYSQSQCLFVFDGDNGDLVRKTELNNSKFIDFCLVERKKLLLIRGSVKPAICLITFK